MLWRFSKYRMLHYQKGEMEGENTDERDFSFHILFLWILTAFCPHMILFNKPCLAHTTAKIVA